MSRHILVIALPLVLDSRAGSRQHSNMTLLPIAPILLLPFILIFFIAVFPVWLAAMMILGAARAIVRRTVPDPTHPTRRRIERAFRWVATFGNRIDWETG
jgi:hypothetical protein